LIAISGGEVGFGIDGITDPTVGLTNMDKKRFDMYLEMKGYDTDKKFRHL
jgi:hypothetical protein